MSTVKKRPANIFRSAFRTIRNVLAALGVCFVYLLVTGYMQYQDRLADGDTSCSFTHCV